METLLTGDEKTYQCPYPRAYTSSQSPSMNYGERVLLGDWEAEAGYSG